MWGYQVQRICKRVLDPNSNLMNIWKPLRWGKPWQGQSMMRNEWPEHKSYVGFCCMHFPIWYMILLEEYSWNDNSLDSLPQSIMSETCLGAWQEKLHLRAHHLAIKMMMFMKDVYIIWPLPVGFLSKEPTSDPQRQGSRIWIEATSSKPISNICLAVMLLHMYKFWTTGNRNKQVRWDQKLGLKQ